MTPDTDNLSTIIKDEVSPDPFPCVKCGRTFKSGQALAMHRVRVHTRAGRQNHGALAARARGKRRTISKAMRASWQRRKLGLNHMGRPAMPNTVSRRTCPVCHVTYSSRPNMTLHLRKVHKKSITDFEEIVRGGAHLGKRGGSRTVLPDNAPTTGTIPDVTGEAAKAIMVAASVIRAVSTGIKITS